ncbi:MAG: glycosyltransferase [Bosea sp. (in: a-proteobacteria)]
MRLAFVTSLIPDAKPATGFEIANAAIIAALREVGHETNVFGFMREGADVPADPRAHLIQRIIIENAAAPASLRARWLMTALRLGLPLAAAKLAAPCEGLPDAIVASGPFDAIILNSVMMPAACPALTRLAPCLLVSHNVEHLTAQENARNARHPLTRWLYAREAKLLKRIEHRLAEECRFVWFLAEEDRQKLGLDTSGRSAVLPLIAPTSLPQTQASLPADAERWDVGMIGTWTWGPNQIGLEWFLKEIAPRLPADITVAIAGRTPSDLVSPRPSIRLVGRVADQAQFLAACRCIALATRAGTGVQLKTLEAFQLGKPTLATPLALRGFAQLPTNLRVADDAPAFAKALAELVADARAGRVGNVNGAAFIAGQKVAMMQAVEAGLASIKA